MSHYLQIQTREVDDPRTPHAPRRRAFTFAYCPDCRGFWPNVSGRELVHRCGPMVGQSLGPDRMPVEFERDMKSIPVQLAYQVAK